MDAFRIPKQRALIDVTYLDGQSARLAVFLAESSQSHGGPERLSELLSGWNDFIPAEDLANGQIIWANRMGLAVVRAGSHLDADEAEYTIPSEEDVSIFLANGTEVRGLLTYVRPPHESRLTDVLNDGRLFVRVLEGSNLAFVNKRHILRVVSHSKE